MLLDFSPFFLLMHSIPLSGAKVVEYVDKAVMKADNKYDLSCLTSLSTTYALAVFSVSIDRRISRHCLRCISFCLHMVLPNPAINSYTFRVTRQNLYDGGNKY